MMLSDLELDVRLGQLFDENYPHDDPKEEAECNCLIDLFCAVIAHARKRGIPLDGPASADGDQGVMTSAAFSPTLGHWIGLGLLTRGPERMGARVRAVDPVRNNDVEVEICAPCFVDPQGERVRG